MLDTMEIYYYLQIQNPVPPTHFSDEKDSDFKITPF